MIAAVCALTLAACGGADRSDGDEGSSSPAGAGEVVREGEHAARLVLGSGVAAPGETVEVAVENVGETDLFYGLATGVERRTSDGLWEPVELGRDAIQAIGLSVPAGETAGPDYGNRLRDAVELPPDLEPGLYHVTKSVNGARRGGPHLSLAAELRVGD